MIAIKPKSCGADDWRQQHPDTALADLLALEIPDIHDPNLDYNIQKAELEKEWCIIESQGRVIFDIKTGLPSNREVFCHQGAGHLSYDGERGSTSKRWLHDANKLVYHDLILTPGPTPEGFLNMYPGFAYEPIEGDISWWLALLDHVFPDQEIRDEIERALLWGFAHPDRWKIHIWIIVQGANGVGKDLVGQFICRLVGHGFSNTITNEQINSQWDDYLKGLFLHVEEAKTDRQVQSKLKKMVTSPRNRINPKYGKTMTIPNMMNGYISSNDIPIVLASDKERRWLYYKSPAPLMPDQMAARMVSKLTDSAALSALMYHAQHLDYADFNERKPAMRTAAFYELANDDSPSDIERWLERAIEGTGSGLAPELMKRDVWQAWEIEECMPNILRGKGSESTITHVMGSLRFAGRCKNFGLIKVKGKPVRLWALRKGTQWAARGNDAIREEFLRGRDPKFLEEKAAKFDAPMREELAKDASLN